MAVCHLRHLHYRHGSNRGEGNSAIMCGIAGIYNLDGKMIDRCLLERMTRMLKHRGPDDKGYYVNGNLGFGHRRLFILDPSPAGHQPMCNSDGTLWITYDGEIYNYVELRSELKKLGYAFRSNTDTEVILAAYEAWGEKCLRRFNGMFAFALWDSRNQRLFCARDCFGLKPFYYYYDGRTFLFASEIKALLEADIERKPYEPLVYQYLVSHDVFLVKPEDTFFEGIKQIPHAHYLLVDRNHISIRRYWDLDPKNRVKFSSDEEYAVRFRELFEDSLRIRLQHGEYSVGALLSGGIDSSSIVCLASRMLRESSGEPLQTFTSCSQYKEHDEREFVEYVIRSTGAKANYVFPDENRLFEEIERVLWHYDEPFGSIQQYALWDVMRATSNAGIRAILDGTGSDLILGGEINSVFHIYLGELLRHFKWGEYIRDLNAYVHLYDFPKRFELISKSFMRAFLAPKTVATLKKYLKSQPSLKFLCSDFVKAHQNDSLYYEKKYALAMHNEFYLPLADTQSLFKIWDRNGMAHSVQVRCPFRDHRLVERIFSFPPEQKVGRGISKLVLRNSMKGIVPERVRLRHKKPWSAPADIWLLRDAGKTLIEGVISSTEFGEWGYFNVDAVKQGYQQFLMGNMNLATPIWRWINTYCWRKIFHV